MDFLFSFSRKWFFFLGISKKTRTVRCHPFVHVLICTRWTHKMILRSEKKVPGNLFIRFFRFFSFLFSFFALLIYLCANVAVVRFRLDDPCCTTKTFSAMALTENKNYFLVGRVMTTDAIVKMCFFPVWLRFSYSTFYAISRQNKKIMEKNNSKYEEMNEEEIHTFRRCCSFVGMPFYCQLWICRQK